MKPLFLLALIFSLNALANSKEDFRSILRNYIQKDPAFKEVDFQTPFFESQLKQGFSQLALPKVRLSYGLYEQKNNVSQATAASRFEVGSLTATYSVFSFGKDWNFYQASRYERKAQLEKVELMLLQREQEISNLLLDYIKESRNLDILGRLIEMKTRALDLSKKRYERGSLSREDHQKVELDVSNARGELLVAQQDFNLLMARLRAYGVEQLPSSYPWENELTLSKINELETINTEVQDLPQFRTVDYALEASTYKSKAAIGEMFGNLRFDFSRSIYKFPGEEDNYEWRTALVYTLPLFEGFTQDTELERAVALRKASEVRQQFEKKLASKTQEAQGENLKVSWKNWIERREALKVSSKLYKGSLNQFNQGLLSVNELLVDQDRLLRTEQIANSTIHQLHQSVLSFCHSRGRAFVKGCF